MSLLNNMVNHSIWYSESFYFDAVRLFVYFWSCDIYSYIDDLSAYSQDSAFSRARVKNRVKKILIGFGIFVYSSMYNLKLQISPWSKSLYFIKLKIRNINIHIATCYGVRPFTLLCMRIYHQQNQCIAHEDSPEKVCW